jgi:CYTH domain-containing protein
MEIEKKYLIKEKEKNFPCIFDINKLKKEIKDKGTTIIQIYLPVKILPEILKEINKKIKFKPNEIRLRKINKRYFLTIKSKGSLSRNEFEIKITKEIYEKYKKFKQKKLKKIRLKKKYKNKILEFDYYPKNALIVMEIEFKNMNEAKNFKIIGKEITKARKYKARNLAE